MDARANASSAPSCWCCCRTSAPSTSCTRRASRSKRVRRTSARFACGRPAAGTNEGADMANASETVSDGRRLPVADTHDASVGLEPVREGEIPSFAYALVKMTYAITHSGLTLADPEPLLF